METMRSVMSRLLADKRTRKDRIATEWTEAGCVTLRCVPVVRGTKVFYRRDWYLKQEKIAASALAKIKLA